MAKTTQWTGNAQQRPQVTEVTLSGAVSGGTTYTVTLLGKGASYTAVAADTKDTVLRGVLTAINESQDTEWRMVRGSEADETLTLIGPDDGRALTYTVSAALSQTTPTTPISKHDWAVAANWDNGVPASGDTVIFADSAIDVRYSLDQTALSALALLDIRADYTGSIGLSRYNQLGFYEAGGRYLAIPTASLIVGKGDGLGSPMIQIDLDAGNTSIEILSTGNSNDPDMSAVRLHDVGNATIIQHDGTCDIAWQPGESSAGLCACKQSGGVLRLGDTGSINATITNATLHARSNAASITINEGGRYEPIQTTTTTITANAGMIVTHGTCTLTTLTMYGQSQLQSSDSPGGCTVTTLNIHGGTIGYPARTVSIGTFNWLGGSATVQQN